MASTDPRSPKRATYLAIAAAAAIVLLIAWAIVLHTMAPFGREDALKPTPPQSPAASQARPAPQTTPSPTSPQPTPGTPQVPPSQRN